MMVTIERGVPLIERVIQQLEAYRASEARQNRAVPPIEGASEAALDAIESRVMVELPPTLRAFLAYDFRFDSLGKRWRGRHRFGLDPQAPRPKVTSVRKLAEAITELGWTDSRLRRRVIRLPNLPGHAWNALYLGEARGDGELPILGVDHEETHVRVFLRYSAFDLYLAEQCGLVDLPESARLDDIESHLEQNAELRTGSEDDDDRDSDY